MDMVGLRAVVPLLDTREARPVDMVGLREAGRTSGTVAQMVLLIAAGLEEQAVELELLAARYLLQALERLLASALLE